MTQDKLLDKLTKIKNMAEGAAAIGSEAEAQAFADMLQKLLLEHDLQMSDLEFEALATDPIEDQYVNFTEHGLKHKKTRVAWMERLAGMVAQANFCRILVSSGSSNIWLVGRREHRAVAEYMIVTLARAVEDISRKEHAKYSWEVYKRDRSTFAARGFKESFITGFLFRLFERLVAMKKTTGESTNTGLMRINREDAAVEAELQRRHELNKGEEGKLRKMGGLRVSAPANREGVRRGKAAAENIDLGGRAIDQGINVNRGRLTNSGS